MNQAASCVHAGNACGTYICLRVCVQIDGGLHLGVFASVPTRGTVAMRCALPSRRHALCGHGDRRVACICALAACRWHGCLHSRRSFRVEEVVVGRLLEEGEPFRDRDPSDSYHPRDHGEVVETTVML